MTGGASAPSPFEEDEMTSRSREERTSYTKHFKWVESYNGKGTVAYRNAVFLMEIQYNGLEGRCYHLVSRLAGQDGFIRSYVTVAEAKMAADKAFEDWVHMLGLEVSDKDVRDRLT